MKDTSTLSLAQFRYSPTQGARKASSPVTTKTTALNLEYATRDLAAEHASALYPSTPTSRSSYRTPAGAKVPAHHWDVYDACLKIPSGRVTTYGALCSFIGSGSARSVGRALAVNPFAPRVPCHRVLPATLFAGGFRGNAPDPGSKSVTSGEKAEAVEWNWHDSVKVQGAEAVRNEKVRMLALEGVRFGADGKLVGGVGSLWRFEEEEGDDESE
ncbi:hypothetical protein PENSPDRAFT_648789 [Peniophora sp. CONT]|nr:hypothetical protein PENSPDRAFT_648789 [Peniophora sp. CONT]